MHSLRLQEPGKPLFVTLLLYLDDVWPRDWDAETLILDTPSDTGLLIRPKVGHLVYCVSSCVVWLCSVYSPSLYVHDCMCGLPSGGWDAETPILDTPSLTPACSEGPTRSHHLLLCTAHLHWFMKHVDEPATAAADCAQWLR